VNAIHSATDARGLVPLVPSVAGALLAFFAAIRISLTARPLRAVALGFVLLVVGSVVPFAAAQLIPSMKSHSWTFPSLLPLFALRIVGLIVLSTVLLRLVVRASERT
jgi:hypothetical protein